MASVNDKPVAVEEVPEPTRCPACGGESQSGSAIAGWGEWRTCVACTLEFVTPNRLGRSPASLFQSAYLGKEEASGMSDFAARLKIRQALKEAPRLWFWNPAFNQIFDWLRREIGPGAVVLDVGSGMGFVLLALREAGFQPVGIDVAEVAVRATTQDGFRVWLGTVATVPPRWVEPKAILALFVLHHLEEPGEFLRTIRSKWPNASLVIAQYGPSNRGPLRSLPPRTLSLWNARCLQVALSKAGYRVDTREFKSTGAENPFVQHVESVLSSFQLPARLYRILKRAEKALTLAFLVPFRRDAFVIVAFAQPI